MTVMESGSEILKVDEGGRVRRPPEKREAMLAEYERSVDARAGRCRRGPRAGIAARLIRHSVGRLKAMRLRGLLPRGGLQSATVGMHISEPSGIFCRTACRIRCQMVRASVSSSAVESAPAANVSRESTQESGFVFRIHSS